MTTINERFAREISQTRNQLATTETSPILLNPRTDNPSALATNLNRYMAPVQLERLRHDVKMWRTAIREAENEYNPQRVRMQRLYLDTVLNGHVWACMEKRKDLTRLRKYDIVGADDMPIEELTKLFRGQLWFYDFQGYVIDAIFKGYQLIKLGDMFNGAFPELGIVKSWNVNPDRKIVTNYIGAMTGVDFTQAPYDDFHLWVTTPTENGASSVGYGLLYRIGLYEIILRNILTYNSDFVELYSQPYRVGKTMAADGDQRDQLDAALRAMGSNGYAILDTSDSIEFLETNLGGTGWQGYDNFEQRLEKKISKLTLGHADALDSTPGKLGPGGDKPPAEKAMEDKQSNDGIFMESVINNLLIPKMISIGITQLAGCRFKFNQDEEAKDQRNQEDTANKTVAETAQTMKNAGLKMSPKYFTERTGIECEEIEEPEPVKPGALPQQGNPKVQPGRIKNKLDSLYKKPCNCE